MTDGITLGESVGCKVGDKDRGVGSDVTGAAVGLVVGETLGV